MIARRLPVLLLLAGLAGLAMACGPSFQAVYEGNVRFEHCYALDMGPVPPGARKDCWHDWLFNYTYGQSRDRVEYAAARFSELSLDGNLPRQEMPSRARVAAVPMPTSAFAPAPNLVSEKVAAPDPESHVASAAPLVQAPGEACSTSCAGAWRTCHETCHGGSCETCDRSYRQCVPRCLQVAQHH